MQRQRFAATVKDVHRSIQQRGQLRGQRSETLLSEHNPLEALLGLEGPP